MSLTLAATDETAAPDADLVRKFHEVGDVLLGFIVDARGAAEAHEYADLLLEKVAPGRRARRKEQDDALATLGRRLTKKGGE